MRAAGGYTAWSDKHPAYDLVNGPDTAHLPGFGTDTPGVNDLFGPEINSVIAVVGGKIADRITRPRRPDQPQRRHGRHHRRREHGGL